jgi:lipid-binding SYLF domain-containing protein
MHNRRFVLALPLAALLPTAARAQWAGDTVAAAEALLRRFRGNNAWAPVWQQIGRAEGVLIAPRIAAEGFLVMQENGSGLVLARHGGAWSDPVGVSLSETSVGLQGGVREFGLVLAVLNRDALRQMVEGGVSYGGSGGFSLGSLGLGSEASIGTSGVDTIAVTVSESGLFAGSGIGDLKLSPVREMNVYLNGGELSPEALLRREGWHANSRGLRELLAEASRAAR